MARRECGRRSVEYERGSELHELAIVRAPKQLIGVERSRYSDLDDPQGRHFATVDRRQRARDRPASIELAEIIGVELKVLGEKLPRGRRGVRVNMPRSLNVQGTEQETGEGGERRSHDATRRRDRSRNASRRGGAPASDDG
jgi:hypothetical protein